MIRYDSSSFQILASSDDNISSLEMALQCQEILTARVKKASQTKRRLDFLLHEFKSEITNVQEPAAVISALNDFLFIKKNISGSGLEAKTDNELWVNSICETRKGQPISLALAYRYLASRSQTCPVNLINMPGFYFVKILYRNQLVFLDPSSGGRELSVSELQKKLSERFGKNMALNGLFLETPTEIQTITRFLIKLKAIYLENRQWPQLVACLDMLIAANPSKISEYRERGMLLYQLGSKSEAGKDLEVFVRKSRPSIEVEKVKNILACLNSPNVTPLF